MQVAISPDGKQIATSGADHSVRLWNADTGAAGPSWAGHRDVITALRYTSDGSTPTAASPLVAGPIAERGVIRVAAFDRNGRPGLVASVDNR